MAKFRNEDEEIQPETPNPRSPVINAVTMKINWPSTSTLTRRRPRKTALESVPRHYRSP